MKLIDSHAHLDAPQFDADRAAVIERARQAGVDEMIVIGAAGTMATVERAVALADTDPKLHVSIGVHPHDVGAIEASWWPRLRELAADPRVCAIGESGLDYFYDHSLDRPEYIEANPRIGETVNANLCGVNLCEMVVQVSLGNQLKEVAPGEVGVKSHADFIALLAHAYNGANRKQLLLQLHQHWTRQGIFEFESELTRPREDWGSLIPATAVSMRLLAFPRSARQLSQKTVQ